MKLALYMVDTAYPKMEPVRVLHPTTDDPEKLEELVTYWHQEFGDRFRFCMIDVSTAKVPTYEEVMEASES